MLSWHCSLETADALLTPALLALLPCPPCSNNARESRSGLFAHPPSPRSFNTTGAQLLRDLFSIEVGQ